MFRQDAKATHRSQLESLLGIPFLGGEAGQSCLAPQIVGMATDNQLIKPDFDGFVDLAAVRVRDLLCLCVVMDMSLMYSIKP